jgi:hypothetical protein
LSPPSLRRGSSPYPLVQSCQLSSFTSLKQSFPRPIYNLVYILVYVPIDITGRWNDQYK